MVTTVHPPADAAESIDESTKNPFDSKPVSDVTETSDDHESESSDETQFIEINEFIKLDLKSNVLVSNDKIDSGTRILIELRSPSFLYNIHLQLILINDNQITFIQDRSTDANVSSREFIVSVSFLHQQFEKGFAARDFVQ